MNLFRNRFQPAAFTILAAVMGVLGAGLLGGCEVNQKREVAIYRPLIDGPNPPVVHVDPSKVITLSECLALADEGNETVAIQGEAYLQALIQKDKAFAAFLPTITLAPDYNGNTGHKSTAAIPFEANLGLNPYTDVAAVSSAKATIEQQKQLIFDAQQTLLLDVATAYYAVLSSEQSVRVLNNSLLVQNSNVQYFQEEARVGTARPLDVAQALSELSATRVQLDQARADVVNDRLMLAYLVNADIANNPLRDDFAPPNALGAISEWVQSAESVRQDLLAADAAVRAARADVDVEFGQYFPTLTFSAQYYAYKVGLSGQSPLEGVVGLSLPLFTGGLINAEVRQAWSQFRQAALTQEQLQRSIDQGVQTAYVNTNLARAELADLSVEVKAAQDAYNLAELSYKTGQVTYLNVLTAQQTLLSTQLQLTTEVFTHRTAYFALLRSAGEMKILLPGASAQAVPGPH